MLATQAALGQATVGTSAHQENNAALDDAEAGVLLVVWTEATIERTAILNLRAEGERDRARLVVLAEARVHFGVTVHEGFEWTVVWAPLRHVDPVVSQENLRVDYLATLGTDASRQLIEDVICVFLLRLWFSHQRLACRGIIIH